MASIPTIKNPNLRPRLRAAGLVLPLMAFVGFTFVAPLATMLVRSVYDPVVADALPQTLRLLNEWDGKGPPAEAVYESAARELVEARENRTLGKIASRVNRVRSGLRSVLTKSARRLRRVDSGPWRDAMIGIDSAWAETPGPGMPSEAPGSDTPHDTI